jgi:hypothetical protein
MTYSVAQLVREAVLLRNEASFVESYLFRTTFIQGATGALLILRDDAESKAGLKTEHSDSVTCFSVGFEMASLATKITSWSKFLESQVKYGFEEDLDYFESTCIESTSKEPIFYFGHALRDGTGKSHGCVIYSANAASSHEHLQSQIGDFASLCFIRILAPVQARWIAGFEKIYSVYNVNQSIFPVFADFMRKLGHGVNNNLATLSLQLQSLGMNSDSPSVVKTGISRSMQSIQRIDDSVQVLEAFSSIILNESNTSLLENYIMAEFDILKRDFNSTFLSVSTDQNFQFNRSINVDGPSLLFLIHNFLRFALVVSPLAGEIPIALVVWAQACGLHPNCATISLSYEVSEKIDPLLKYIADSQILKIGGPLSPPILIVMDAAKKLGAEFLIFRIKEEAKVELHLPLLAL